MTPLRRLGDLVIQSEEDSRGERRVLPGADRLATKIFFPDHLGLENYYIFSSPVMVPQNFKLPAGMPGIGEEEANFISKLFDPPGPVLAIVGPLGSGKSTSIEFVIRHVLQTIECEHCLSIHEAPCQRMIAWIDCKQFTEQPERTTDEPNGRLIQQVCIQLWARATKYLTDGIEFVDFWNYILSRYDLTSDLIISNVAGCLLMEDPSIQFKLVEPSAADLNRRKQMREKLRQTDTNWYLNYLVLLWRFLIETRFTGRKDCGLIVLDNVDSLHPKNQSSLLNFINRNTHHDGPTFILLIRPETKNRHSLNDMLADFTTHHSPTPAEVIFDRLEHFLANPAPYLAAAGGLTTEHKELVLDYLKRITPRLKDDKSFNKFIKSAAGMSIRNALVLAQEILTGVTIAEMRNPDLTPHFIVRACITQGHGQFKADPKNRLDNPFDIAGVVEGYLLLKPRLLKFIQGRGKDCKTSLLLNAFSLFGYTNDQLYPAINDLLRMECQLLTSDGFDYFHKTRGDDQETLYLTKVGEGYVDHLLHDVDFVQEVMLDTKIETSEFPVELGMDRLEEKFSALYYFMRTLQKVDKLEVHRFVNTHTHRRYISLFGTRMLTLDLLWSMTPSIERILLSSARRYPDHEQEYLELRDKFLSLIWVAEKDNRDLLAVHGFHYTPYSGK